MPRQSAGTLKKAVKEKYGKLAVTASKGEKASCCDPEVKFAQDPFATSVIYASIDIKRLPNTITSASAGCGNPIAISELNPGETVLDLGSGGGIDCFLAREKVGPEGKVIGLDMTPQMLDLARRNAQKLGYINVEFVRGEMENNPMPDSSVDVIISNCVIDLSPDKDAVLRHAFRVLKPGGRLCISDIVLRKPLPRKIREDLELWAGCIAGAMVKEKFLEKVRRAGFTDIVVQEEKPYGQQVDNGDNILSITFKARKP